MKETINTIRFTKWQTLLSDWSIVKVTGVDRLSFLHGQTTNNLKDLQNHFAELNVRLNRAGKVQSFFYNVKFETEVLIFINKHLKENLIKDLSTYIIADDVEFSETNLPLWFVANDFEDDSIGIKGKYAGLSGKFYFEKTQTLNELFGEEFKLLQDLNGFPVWGKNIDDTKFINETILNEFAISYSKGCFLGQETVSKIENNRGAALYPCLIKFEERPLVGSLILHNVKIGEILDVNFYNEKYYAHALLNRENRIIGKKVLSGEVYSYPFFKNSHSCELALELYENALDVFNKGDTILALELIERSLELHVTADTVEVQGVLFARINKYNEAIECMTRLSELDPSSVMAHTNKSLYLMKIGKIAEAEEEKSIATVKGFEKFGDEARLKKKITEDKLKKENEMLSRELMFKQVLEIDPDDNLANFGMADIKFLRGEFSDSINYLLTVLKVDPKYSQGYLLLGKNYEAIKEHKLAFDIYNKGIVVASSQGEMMPANEMQSRLNKLSTIQ